MISFDEVCVIGNTNKPHGINGEISASIDAECGLSSFSCVIFEIDGILVPFFMESYRFKHANSFLIKFYDLDKEQEVVELSNKSIYALKAELPSEQFDNHEEGMYVIDFVGYSVETNTGEYLGTIVDFDDSTDNMLFIVERTDNTILYIPIVDEFIDEINTQDKILSMTLPVGLLEL